MRSFTASLLAAGALALSPVLPAHAETSPATPAATPSTKKPEAHEKCEHGVKKTLCTRCNPKLAAVFKAKGDWCHEHDRPESQCAICHPELEKLGVKP